MPREIHFTFDLADPGVVHITAELPGTPRGAEVLTLPSSWAGQLELYRALRNLRSASPDVSLRSTDSPARWLLQMREPGTARFTYDLVQDRPGPLRAPLEHRVILTPTLWACNGENALVLPAHRGDAPVHAVFDFTGLAGQSGGASSAGLITSFGQAAHQEYRGSWSGVTNALFAGGDLRLRRFRVGGELVVLAATPEMDAMSGAIAPRLAQILQTERGLWAEADQEYGEARYGILLASYEGLREGAGGSGFTDAATLFFAPEQPLDEDSLALLAHETLHRWLPERLGFVADTQQIAWFGEGFTRFYESVVLRRAGLLSEEEYLARTNALLRSYRVSPRLHASNAELQEAAPGDWAAFEQPYLRGAMIALWLDGRIALASGSRAGLTDFVQALRTERRQPLTAERIVRTAARFIGDAAAAQLRQYALDGVEVPVESGSLGECVAFRPSPAWTYALGFDAASLAPKGRVRGVEQGSNAYLAGVRDGQELGEWTVWRGDAQREVTLQLREADGTRSRVSFLPQGRVVEVPQATRLAGCVAAVRVAR